MHRFEKIIQWFPVIILGITPLFFLPITADYYDLNKWSLLVLSALIIILGYGIILLTHNRFIFRWSPLATALFFLMLASLVSTLVVSANKSEALTALIGVPFFASLFILVIRTDKNHKLQDFLTWFLSAGAGVVGLLAIYQALGFGKTLTTLSFLANPLWTPVGSSLALVSLLCISLPISAGLALRHFQKKEEGEGILAAGISVITTVGLFVTLWQISKQPVTLLSQSSGWAIFLEAIKNPIHLLFGVGPENFLSAFTAGRPMSLNNTDIWNIRFTSGSSFILHNTTTLGLTGIIGLLLLIRSMILPVITHGRRLTHLDHRLALLCSLLVLFILPPSIPVFVIITVAILIAEESNTITIDLAKYTAWIGTGIAVICFLFSLAGLFFLSRFFVSNIAYGRALSFLNKNDGTAGYQALIRAVSTNKESPVFHSAMSKTALTLANTILTRASDSKLPISESDKQLVSDFYQLAIREAKLSVKYAPVSVIAWENLADTYRSFLGVAQNADTWTIAALAQAIQLDPTNPSLFMNLGSVYLRTNRMDEAVTAFQQAIALKNDLANAHYNLAYTYRQKNEYGKSAMELRKTNQFVTTGSLDQDRINAELSEVMSKLTNEEITRVSQAPLETQPVIKKEEILSPTSEFAPIPSPTTSLPLFSEF